MRGYYAHTKRRIALEATVKRRERYTRRAVGRWAMVVTDDFIRMGATTRPGGWCAEQLAILGERWPPLKGWRARAVGRVISEQDAARFLALKGGVRASARRQQRSLFGEE